MSLRSKYRLNLTVCFLLFSLVVFSIDNLFPKLVAVSARSIDVKPETRNLNSTNVHESTNHARVSEAYGKLPISFEINQGQVDEQVSFFSRGSGYNVFLTSNEAVLSLNVPLTQEGRTESLRPSSIQSTNAQADSGRTTHDVVRMKLVGANPSVRVTGLEELPGKSNYLFGNDPMRWRTNISHYARVRYEAVYHGVDLIYYGNQQQLEYDFVVAPGANPSAIKQLFKGTQDVEIDASGDLVLRTRGGEVRQRKPFIYQETNGLKHQIAGGYVRTGKRQVGFTVGAYDPNLPLVIDPVLSYSSYLGGSGTDQLEGIALDGGGSAYVAGLTSSPTFPTTGGAFQPNLAGGSEGFVTKFDPTGSVLIYSTYLGGTDRDSVSGLAVDVAGQAYVCGSTISPNFPTTSGVFDPVLNGASDGYVLKLSASGATLIYSTLLGGSDHDSAFDLAIDGAGNAYVTGETKSLNFPTTPGVFDVTFNSTSSDEDAFATKVNSTGSTLVYSTYLGGSSFEAGSSIVVDGAGNAYIAGSTRSANFPRTVGAFDESHNGSFDIFALKLNSTASGFFYSTLIGGSLDELANGIAIDLQGSAYVTGYTLSSNFPVTSSAFDRVLSGPSDAFVTKVNQLGTGLTYSTYLGGSDVDIGFSVVVDTLGQAYAVGHSYSTNFPTTVGAFDTSHNGINDIYVTKLNQSGSTLLYSTFLGGGLEDIGRSIVIDEAGNVYIGGLTNSTNFPTTPGAFDTSSSGDGFHDSIVARFQAELMGNPVLGLKGYWTFDENTGTTTVDASGNANTGTLTAGAGWSSGQSSSAVSLDGLNNYVQVGAQSSLVMTSAATFTAWIHPTGGGSNASYGGAILGKEGEYVLARFPSGRITWGVANSNPGWVFTDSGYEAPLNQWTHIALTYNNGTTKIYANGSLVQTISGSGSIGDVTPGQNDFRIGGREGISQLFQGRIDEVRVYNRALAASEITGLMGSGLKGYWKFDENTGTFSADASGSGNTGTLTSGAGWGSGQSGSAVSLDGVNDHVQVGARSSLVLTSAATFTAWIHPMGTGSNASYGGAILGKEGEYVLARFPDGRIKLGFANSNPGWVFIDTGYVAPLNQWTHIAATYDSGIIKTYANGSLVHIFSGSGFIGDVTPGQNDFRIGSRQGMLQHFHGRIDEVRVYIRALTASEITGLMGSGLKGYWKFDESGGTTTADASGSSHTGTLTAGAGWASGQNNSAVSLDGVNDYVQVGAPSSLVMTSAATFTAWIHPTGAGSNAIYGGAILGKEGEYVLARSPSGRITWGVANTNPGWVFTDSGYEAPLNQWTHIALTYDNGTTKIYANGDLVHTFSGSGFIGDVTPGENDFRIGGRQGISQHFQGRIDEVRVYIRALTASEIDQLQ